jgi:hypothetical protein
MPLDHPHFRHLVCFNFHVGWRHIQAIYRQAFPNGVNPQRAYLLCACDPDRPTPVASPLDALELDSLAMSGLLARFQAQGLLPREVDPDDRREILVHLTPEGVELPPGHRRAGQGGRPAPGRAHQPRRSRPAPLGARQVADLGVGRRAHGAEAALAEVKVITVSAIGNTCWAPPGHLRPTRPSTSWNASWPPSPPPSKLHCPAVARWRGRPSIERRDRPVR